MPKTEHRFPVGCCDCGKQIGWCDWGDSPANYIWCTECEQKKETDSDES